jgi:hypothetical protein
MPAEICDWFTEGFATGASKRVLGIAQRSSIFCFASLASDSLLTRSRG